MRVLIIASDPALTGRLRRRLWREGHVVDVASSGELGLEGADGGAYDALILDAETPPGAGATTTRRLRAAGIATPILLLAAHARPGDRVQGLDAGADDYLTAPFAFAEFAARLRAVARRGEHPPQEDRLTLGDLVLDRRTRVARRGSRPLTLAPREFALLEYLLRHPGQVLPRTMLLERIWGYDIAPVSNVLSAAIKRLRAAVDAGEPRPLIHTVRGVGYKIQDGA